ncbi:enolase C-terminal domain-like protein [Paenibacillus hamazuiensis]|uniref:enolase C-terminal domain-like protein n=1 Tax=Paenibacillus hamazuiensis TaxID=2936508 RepID=UPI00200C8A54|nr:enolase C-terminal domain-like protein [Paenibacillus hamazuiensis]
MKSYDISIKGLTLHFLPVKTRVPLKFGAEVLTNVTCARVCIVTENRRGECSDGWGETPLSVQWVWPSSLGYEVREQALQKMCELIANDLSQWKEQGHAFELGYKFQKERLPGLVDSFNAGSGLPEPLPYLAALVCFSLFDIALHDAYGRTNRVPVYETYNRRYMNADLSAYLQPAEDAIVRFDGFYPEHFFQKPPQKELLAWHLVGGKDLLHRHELTGEEKVDGYPYTLEDWIERDGLQCLKIKLTGSDSAWDYNRLVEVGGIALSRNVVWLTADFNCQVTDSAYVNDILDRLMNEHPDIYKAILYIEQPFPYDLEANRLDVRSVSARKPLFMDESAHDWELIKLGRELGWTGVALKTCKTQTGALLSLCWAKAHGMTLMVQDLTNPMLAQIPHVLLAYHAGTIMGVETNGMQFYPEASSYEALVHPGLYRRQQGKVRFDTVQGYGFGYRVEEMQRPLPEPAVHFMLSERW